METSSKKRSRSPTFQTPIRPAKSQRNPLRQQMDHSSDHPVVRLSSSFSSVTITVWEREEIKALVEFILLMSPSNKWPCHKNMTFWREAGNFVQKRVGSHHISSCVNMYQSSTEIGF